MKLKIILFILSLVLAKNDSAEIGYSQFLNDKASSFGIKFSYSGMINQSVDLVINNGFDFIFPLDGSKVEYASIAISALKRNTLPNKLLFYDAGFFSDLLIKTSSSDKVFFSAGPQFGYGFIMSDGFIKRIRFGISFNLLQYDGEKTYPEGFIFNTDVSFLIKEINLNK